MKTDNASGKTTIPAYCEKCEQEMFYLSDDLEGSYFLACPHCRFETSCVWCSNCGMGGPFIREIEKRPQSWQCPDCESQHSLSFRFYDTPIILLREGDLPSKIRWGHRVSKLLVLLVTFLGLAAFIFLFFSIVVILRN